jgi:hypothetical protein
MNCSVSVSPADSPCTSLTGYIPTRSLGEAVVAVASGRCCKVAAPLGALISSVCRRRQHLLLYSRPLCAFTIIGSIAWTGAAAGVVASLFGALTVDAAGNYVYNWTMRTLADHKSAHVAHHEIYQVVNNLSSTDPLYKPNG